METLYGESPEIQMDDGYGRSGGIALYSAGDGGRETITSSDQGGEEVVGGRVLWEITDLGNGNYSGGITGENWMPEYICPSGAPNPFNQYTSAQIWDIAFNDRNLNKIFDQFENPFDFASYVYENRRQCIAGSPF